MSKSLYQPRSGVLTVQYEPDAQTKVIENPPRFTWIPARLEKDCYVLEISERDDFPSGLSRTYAPVPYNFFTPEKTFAPGTYYWRYALYENDKRTSEWSVARSFSVPENLPETPLPAKGERFKESGCARPRLWLQGEEGIARYREKIAADPEGTGWKLFYALSVLPWAEREPHEEPEPYPGNKRTVELWRQSYIACQEMLYAIRHLSIAGKVLDDSRLLGRAKAWLLAAASWDPEGPTGRDYNDEAAFRMAGALAWGYDWLHGELDAEERERVKRSLAARTRQVAVHAIRRSKIHQVPYDSHAVRSLSSVLTPCCISLLHEEPEAEEWLHYTLEYFWTLYTPWGGEDGGWAEGPHYWTTGMAALLEAIEWIRGYTRLNLFDRPFFRKTGDFPLYVYNPNASTRTTFGDNSSLGGKFGVKTGYNMRHLAGVTGNGRYQWYYERIKEMDPEAAKQFHNHGWWDFRFDELVYRQAYPQIQAEAPSDTEELKWFRDVGWVAMHHRMDDQGEQIMLLTKASKYGSVSHSHADQGAFYIHAFGEALAVETGYYVAFNSTMHRNWRRQTVSKNSLLIDGAGQYAGTDKSLNMAASGTVAEAKRDKNGSYVKMDVTAAYLEQVPYAKRVEREIYFVDNSYFVVVDSVDLNCPGRIEWLYHALYEMDLQEQSFRVTGKKASLEGRFVFCSSGELTLSQSNEFSGVDEKEIEGLSRQWHLKAESFPAASHRLVTLLVPKKPGEEDRYVSYFMDDQGFVFSLYFTDNGKTRKIDVQKAF
ncbi:DUF4962 domain-containing protein [Paenibacillus chitinolyticus]|uniref:DUF4962 domain-containing protein n=1 Tax=Paenibacillus chitinolyticus TaxID=79263 RepID=UPI001C475FCC|nr:DUF4962 domain-containing protein [Paenibacillus chitinolyticus]MBV6714759.1 DUF4962 domain-containing protein [Paenibacillus chitinolyticus]